MEAKLKTDSIDFLRKVLDTSLTHEETAEIIVPDTLPDILEIVDVEGNLTLRSKEAGAGRVSLSGTVGASVVYQPEGESCLKKLELSIPFTAGCDAQEVTDESKVSVTAKIGSIDARMINSRKALVRVDILVEVLCYAPASLSCTSGMEADGEAGLEVRRDRFELGYVSQVREKTFVLSDEFNLPPGKPPVGEILKTRVSLEPDDVKNVGNKLIFKGVAQIHMLYAARDTMEATPAEFSATFSQIMELEGESEGAAYDIALMLTNVYIESAGSSETDCVSVEMHMVAQAVERKSRQIEYISDAYSTRYSLQEQRSEILAESEEGPVLVPGEIRETVELPASVARVVDSRVSVGKVLAETKGEKLCLSAPVCLSVIYMTEEGKTCGLNRRFEVKTETEARGSMAYTASAAAGRDALVTPAPDGIEVKIPVLFSVRPCRKVRLDAVTGAGWDEEKPRDMAALPSVVVYHAVGGENLWHLAKRYCSTEELIIKANGIDEEIVPYPGQLFIIPKVR